MQLTKAAACLTAPPVLPDSARLREKLREKIRPIEVEKAEALTRLRHRRLEEMQKQVTPEMIHELDEALANELPSSSHSRRKEGQGGGMNTSNNFTKPAPDRRFDVLQYNVLLEKLPLRFTSDTGM